MRFAWMKWTLLNSTAIRQSEMSMVPTMVKGSLAVFLFYDILVNGIPDNLFLDVLQPEISVSLCGKCVLL